MAQQSSSVNAISSMMWTSHYRLPAKLPFDKKLEEVILDRKLATVTTFSGISKRKSSYLEVTSERIRPQRDNPASVPRASSFPAFQLPPESYVQEVSSRLGKRPRNRKGMMVRAADHSARPAGYSPPQLRPLTGASPPSTAPSSFSVIDVDTEELDPDAAGLQVPPQGVQNTSRLGGDDSRRRFQRANNDVHGHVSFLTDKCNALSTRLQRIESQLSKERGKEKNLLTSRPQTTRYRDTIFDPMQQQPHDWSTTADPCLLPSKSIPSREFLQGLQPHSLPGGVFGSSGRDGGCGGGCSSAYTCQIIARGKCDVEAPPLDDSGQKSGGNVDHIGVTGKPEELLIARSTPRGHTIPPHDAQEAGVGNSEAFFTQGLHLKPKKTYGSDSSPVRRFVAGTQTGEKSGHYEVVEQQIATRFEVVREGMGKLENVFTGATQILERRVRAITAISSAIRMYLQRCRYLRAKDALRTWRIGHSKPVLHFLQKEILRQKAIETGLEDFARRRRRSVVAKVFESWPDIIIANGQCRQKVKMLQERVEKRQRFHLMRSIFRELRELTVGPCSSRCVSSHSIPKDLRRDVDFTSALQAKAECKQLRTAPYRELARRGLARMEEARARVITKAAACGEVGLIITRTMIRQEMYRWAVEHMQQKVNLNLSRLMIVRLKDAVELRKAREVTAKAHFKRWVYSRVMNGWRKWMELKASGVERKLMSGYKAGVSNRYNPNKIAAFTRRRAMVSVFRAWAAKSAQLTSATRMLRRKLTKVAMAAFATWKMETKRSKKVKKTTIATWEECSSVQEPFRMWYIYAEDSKRQSEEHERLLRLHRRAKNRKKCHTIMKAWRHFAVYGRVEGMYSRSQLLSSLAEQKEHTHRLMKRVDELVGELGDMEELAMEYRSRMIVCQKDVRESQISTDRQTMALHLAEEEIVRLQSLLSTAATVAPIVCKAVLKAAPGFDFKDRGFEPLARERARAMKIEENARVKAPVVKRMKEQAVTLKEADESGTLESSVDGEGAQSDGSNIAPLMQTTRSSTSVRIPTADAQIQARLPPNPEAEARTAVAVAALATGADPPLLPRELVRLDRVEWVLRRTSFAEIVSRLNQQEVDREMGHDGQEKRSSNDVEELPGSHDPGAEDAVELKASERVSIEAATPSPTASATTTASMILHSEKAEDKKHDIIDRLASLFEFLRSGNSLLLPPELRREWDARPDLGLALLADDDHNFDSCHRIPATAREDKSVSANGGTSGVGEKSSSGMSSWDVLRREHGEVGHEPLTYHDLRMMLASTTARGRRTESLDDRLERRLVDRRLRAEERATALWNNDRAEPGVNLYARSWHPPSTA